VVLAAKVSLPIAVFLFAVVLDFNEHKPTATLFVPVVLAHKAKVPTAVLLHAVVLAVREK
jgi:hypothetical protein